MVLGGAAPNLGGAEVLRPEINDHIRARYLGEADRATYLIRPDQVVAARWVDVDAAAIEAAAQALWKG